MTDRTELAKPARKRMAIYRASDAYPLAMTEYVGVDDRVMEKLGFQQIALQEGVTPEVTNVAFCGGGVSLTHAWFKSGYIVPRHSHDSDCLYYILAGEALLGTQVLKAGDGMFVPAGDGYTLEAGKSGVEFLEFRTKEHFNLEFKHNSDAHYQRIKDAFTNNTERWATEARPSQIS